MMAFPLLRRRVCLCDYSGRQDWRICLHGLLLWSVWKDLLFFPTIMADCRNLLYISVAVDANTRLVLGIFFFFRVFT